MNTKFKEWHTKIKDEYRRAGMNPVQFIYYTILSDIYDFKLNRRLKKEKA